MKWFPGTISEAVATTKSRKAIFVVFVAGTDEMSIGASKVIDTPEISSILEKDDFVAIRLESGSQSCEYFVQIYPLVPVPSLFFIGENGKPIEMVCGAVTAPDLMKKIDSVLTKVGKVASSNDFIKAEQSNAEVTSNPSQSTSSTSTSNKDSSSTSVPMVPIDEPVENKPSEAAVPQVETVAAVAPVAAIDASQNNLEELPEASKSNSSEDTASTSRVDDVPKDDKEQEKKDLSSEEKVERAKVLIELQKQQRIEQEKEKEKNREKERREIGKQIQSSRRKQQDLEMRLAHEERKREKAAEMEARERIRQQIEQDKLERKQKTQEFMQTTRQQQQQNQELTNAFNAFKAGDGNVRIQFRLPSGNPHTATFEATTTLREMRSYVVSNIDLPFQQFSLSISFPRRDLNQDDDDKTLMELQLFPTAVILILPIRNIKSSAVVSADDSSFLSRFMWALFAPILTVYNYISGLLFGTRTRVSDTNQRAESNVHDPPNRTGGVYASTSQSNVNQSTGAIKRNLAGTSTTVRARGNVHRLHSGGEDNDENNTWNGNSTQQM